MIFEVTREIWKDLQPVRNQPGFRKLLGSLEEFQAENLGALTVLDGNECLRAQGKAQLLKQLLDGIEKEPAGNGTKGGVE